MCGLDGKTNKSLTKMTWEDFTKWQRWDEFPELVNNPPMTLDVTFFYNDCCFYIDSINGEYVFQTDSWEVIASNENFLKLLTVPLEIFDKRSFKTVIEVLEFDT